MNTALKEEILVKNLFQTGVLNRASRSIINSHFIGDLADVVRATMETLNQKGCGKIEYLDFRQSIVFGGKLSSHQCQRLAEIPKQQGKIFQGKDYLLLKTENILIVLLTEQLRELEVSLLKDNLATLMDTLQTWIDKRVSELTKTKALMNERKESADQLHGVSECLGKLGDHVIDTFKNNNQALMGDLVALFPRMGLEPDQEEAILELISQGLDKQRSALETLLNYNLDLKTMMDMAVGTLTKELAHTSNPDSRNISSIEMF